jgi:hypothetical protein
MVLSFAVVCEAKADKDTACGLADCVFRSKLGVSQDVMAQQRIWRGLDASTEFLKWTDIKGLVRERLSRLPGHLFHGHFGGQPASPDAHIGRRALLLLAHAAEPAAGVFLIRDDDRDKERRKGLEQAREEAVTKRGMRAAIVIGLAHPMREAWVLAGYEPQNDNERTGLKELRQETGFQPHEAAQNLTAKHDHDQNSAKRVLRKLTGGNQEREAKCWENPDLAKLKTRGAGTGLAEYLHEVEERIVPLFS